MKRTKGERRAELYDRILTVDPPLCAQGDPVAVLNACDRRRRMLDCLCRFDANEIASDATLFGCTDLASAFDIALEPEDVESVAADLEICLRRSTPSDEVLRDAHDRLQRAASRLERVVDAGAGLTDEYSDAVDP